MLCNIFKEQRMNPLESYFDDYIKAIHTKLKQSIENKAVMKNYPQQKLESAEVLPPVPKPQVVALLQKKCWAH